jgi:hypothetical protein
MYRIVSGVFVGTVAPWAGDVIISAGMALSETEDVCPRPLVYEIVYDPPAATAGTTPSYVPGPAKGSLYLSRTPLHRTVLLCGSLTVLF